MDTRAKLDEPYRMACPRGHTALHPHSTTDTVQCRTCKLSYAFDELVDRAVDAEP